MPFGAWLRQPKHAQSALGELVRSALSDLERPRPLRSKQEWDRYLLRRLTMSEAMRHTHTAPLTSSYPCTLCGKTKRWNDRGVWRCVACWPP